ncbi:heparan-alpha-glucosaminide N-acetyltransferase domain-containing protein [Thalassotalea euphylliae]|uniref:heparan-alpha-glucosaminide N-acetyltransferase domain-containing protein n=1 Tax=Thalassotalea euphylliae TaxID=1655234 RepID=UPI003640463F
MKSTRLEAIDFARGLSVIIMVCVHTLWMYGDTYTQTEAALGSFIHKLGQGTAAFLITMGISMALSSRTTPVQLAKRGIYVLSLGYLMNALKFIVPIGVFGTMPESFVNAYGWESPLTQGQYLYLLRTGDILQMAGVSLFLLALINLVTSNKYVYLGLAFVVAATSQVVRGYQPGIEGVNYVADLFFGANYNVYFPVFPWFSSILIGAYLGKCFSENKDPEKLYVLSLKWGLGLSASGIALSAYDYEYHFADFFHTGPGGIMYLTGFNLVALWLVGKMIKNYGSTAILNKIMNSLSYCSRHVTTLYIAQWTLICWGMGVVGFKTLSPWQVVAMMPIMLAITLVVHHALLLVLTKAFSRGKNSTDIQPIAS